MKVESTARSVVQLATRRPWGVIGLWCLLAALALLVSGQRLGLRSSNLDLVDPELPEVARFLEFAEEFGTPNVLVVVLEGEDPGELAEAAEHVGRVVSDLKGVRSVLARKPLDSEIDASLQPDPYFTSFDERLFFVFVQPQDARSRADTIAPFVETVRGAIARAGVEGPGIEVGFTGLPQYALDDRDTVRRDISRLSLASLTLVLAIFLVGFGSVARPLLAVTSLLAPVAVTLGLAALYPGHLTLLSAFFAPILLGLGVDFGIHVIDRVEECLGEGLETRKAVETAVSTLARSLLVSAGTTSALFFTMLLCGFRGFEELGFVAGVGVLLCLVSMVSLLPALLVLTDSRRQSRAAGGRRLGRWLVASQSRALAVALVVGTLLASLVGAPRFDADYLNLQPEGSEAVRLEREMVDLSGYSTQFAAFSVDSREDARELTEALWEEESVGAVRSALETGVEAALANLPPASTEPLRRMLISPEGKYAVYAYPAGDVWEDEGQREFVRRMKAHDLEVTGMPILGRFMVARSRRALRITGLLGSLVLLACVWLGFRSLRLGLLAMLPTAFAVAATLASMRLLDLPFNPLNVMALPVVLGIAVDDGIYVVHRFLAEHGDLRRTLTGSGRAVCLTSMTTVAAFGCLGFSAHQGLASFARVVVIGVVAALVFSVWLLPVVLAAVRQRLGRPLGGALAEGTA